MTKEEIAKRYLFLLEKGDVAKVVDLFTDDGIVVSPLYGTLSAAKFYKDLSEDTNSSKLHLDGIFLEKDTNRLSLLFDYEWILKNNEKVNFKVVDILDLSEDNKIQKLTIIYDTVNSRRLRDTL
ncbi:nuclear transport factor 2 family protein [uncultured Aquimarina sp.]|uniref:nuclear transport factor 2 family protein n=1 Tax=uncultured Aquimarina sp. TaxID=575652 RepID=UPI0026354E6A|nr:nuclear transport factor 2 family protein [uncultured Aquimarina sp.]